MACMDVTESDHKPVRCKLNVDIAHVDKTVRRQEFGKILESNEAVKSSLEALHFVPEVSVNTDSVSLLNQETFSLKISKRSSVEVVFFQILCKGLAIIKEDEASPEFRPGGSLGFHRWLEGNKFFICIVCGETTRLLERACGQGGAAKRGMGR